MQHDRLVAAKFQELYKREAECLEAIEQWDEAVPCDVHIAKNGGTREDCEKFQKLVCMNHDKLVAAELSAEFALIHNQIAIVPDSRHSPRCTS